MKQITIVHPVKEGLLAAISECLGNASINIETMEAFNVRDWDIIQLTVSDYDHALRVLRSAGYDAIAEDAVVINIKDEPGSLANITRRLHQGGVSMRSARILHRQGGEAMIAIAMNRTEEGMRLIQDLLVAGTTAS